MKQKVLSLVMVCALTSGVTVPLVAQNTAVQTEDYTIPEGTEFKLQLHTTVSSESSKAGDRIMTTLYDPVYVYDENVLPKGSRVDGHIGEVQAARHKGRGGYLTIVFDSVELPNGEKVALLGSLTEVFSNESNSDPTVGVEGDLKGRGASKKERLAIVAIPTAGAAAAGIGPAIAAAAIGTVAAFILPKGKKAALSAGSLIGMRLDRDLTVTIPITQ